MMNKELKPEKSIKGLTFIPVPEFSDADIAFGAHASAYFNRYDLPDVPSEYELFVQNLCFSGGKIGKMSDGIDPSQATRACKAWLSSFAPSHESKISTVAYALWAWGMELPK